MKIIENFESSLNFEKIKEFDEQKTKVFKYITYKKRTEQEVRNKFRGQIDEEMLEEIIDYLKEAKYLEYDEVHKNGGYSVDATCLGSYVYDADVAKFANLKYLINGEYSADQTYLFKDGEIKLLNNQSEIIVGNNNVFENDYTIAVVVGGIKIIRETLTFEKDITLILYQFSSQMISIDPCISITLQIKNSRDGYSAVF